jgi:hypothetical protein
MARLRIWLRRHIRGLRRTSKSKTGGHDRHNNNTAVALKNLRISTPVLISNDTVNAMPYPPAPFNFSLPIPAMGQPTPEPVRHSIGNLAIPQYKEMAMEDTQSISAPSTLVEEIEAAPSLCEDSDEEDAMPEHLWPATPTSPTHSRRRMSFLRVLGATPDHHNHPYDPLTSRPQSFDFASPTSSRRPSATPEHNRTSHYSVLSQNGTKRISVVSQGNKRISTVSQSSGRPSFNNRRRASVMSVSAANNRHSGIEWDESRISQRFSRRMSWGFETFSTHTEAYVPGRI